MSTNMNRRTGQYYSVTAGLVSASSTVAEADYSSDILTLLELILDSDWLKVWPLPDDTYGGGACGQFGDPCYHHYAEARHVGFR
jgi:hypothetical protein